ncbi:MAG: DNA methylase N-4 [Reyranella sp.]|nr:MAG: DNA methylase N-4 [Reyranella sp.]
MVANPYTLAPLAVIYRSVDSLTPNRRNARTHPKRQLDQIAASIGEFGFTNPILIDPTGTIIAGHGRLLAAKAIGLSEVPTIALTGLSETQKRALQLADNKIALGAGWDPDLLKVELSELDLGDLSLTGFSVGEIDVLLKGTSDPADEVIPSVPVEPRTRPGDIWIAGEHRIGCGDGRDLAFLEEVMGPGTRADVAFLDPPYNVRINGHANAKGRHREFAMASGEMNDEAFRKFLTDTLSTCARLSREGAVNFICIDWRHMDDVSIVGKGIYGDLLNLCVWNKSNAGMGSLYRSKHELVFVYRVGKAPHFNAVELGRHGRNRTNVWDYASVNSMAGSRREDLTLHPTVKPTALVADAVQDVTRRGEVVLDIFLGSGTTLIAAERTGRRFRGVELDPTYVDVALARWSAMTGHEPHLAKQGSA